MAVTDLQAVTGSGGGDNKTEGRLFRVAVWPSAPLEPQDAPKGFNTLRGMANGEHATGIVSFPWARAPITPAVDRPSAQPAAKMALPWTGPVSDPAVVDSWPLVPAAGPLAPVP